MNRSRYWATDFRTLFHHDSTYVKTYNAIQSMDSIMLHSCSLWFGCIHMEADITNNPKYNSKQNIVHRTHVSSYSQTHASMPSGSNNFQSNMLQNALSFGGSIELTTKTKNYSSATQISIEVPVTAMLVAASVAAAGARIPPKPSVNPGFPSTRSFLLKFPIFHNGPRRACEDVEA